jgi:hypothetical protein
VGSGTITPFLVFAHHQARIGAYGTLFIYLFDLIHCSFCALLVLARNTSVHMAESVERDLEVYRTDALPVRKLPKLMHDSSTSLTPTILHGRAELLVHASVLSARL